jgi:hypothetical protein
MTDWSTVATFATALGTLALAVATFAAVRSGNRAARIAERSFQIGLRPILAPSRWEDPPQKIMFGDRHWVLLEGARASVEDLDGVLYLAMPVRNVGNGMAVIEAWRAHPGLRRVTDGWLDPDEFQAQTRSLWVAPGDVAFWQGALRDPGEELFGQIRRAIADGEVSVDLLYRDHEGGQRTVSRFSLIRREAHDEDAQVMWLTSLSAHHPPSAEAPRPEP